GSGKTSILNLLGRFYDPSQGAVRIDGHDLRTLTLDSLRRAIGIVPQDVVLFADTIERNLAFARPNAPRERIVSAAIAAEAHRFIEALPEGYATTLGERGTGLSGGQRQRSSIARAILPDAPILVLDDSTSALDTHTERLVLNTIFGMERRPTTLIVAQRLSAARRADLILVIEEGRLTQRGTHADLVAAPGLYQRMWREQASVHEDADHPPAGAARP
ncbi:MAG: ATP-binding cassette domain-containing protein, partial [Actinobacteria bacterium]|nr:ATP-binding cassette domain-containing protein [Actinomycetota bacterium]